MAANIKVADIKRPNVAEAVGHKSCFCLATSNNCFVVHAKTRQFFDSTIPLKITD